MTHELSSSALAAGLSYKDLFEALPGNHLLLQANAPQYTILTVTPQHLNNLGMKKEDLVGKGLFEVFPSNVNDSMDTGETDLRASLEQVLTYKKPHLLPVQRYDLAGEDGCYGERYWKTENRPVFNDAGEVVYIIHTTEDITPQVKAGELKERIQGMEQAYNLFMQTPIPICILKGPELVVELANEPTLQLWGRTGEVIGLPLEQAVSEVKGQGYLEMIDKVRQTGIANQVYESPVKLLRNGQQQVAYINYVYEPYYEEGQADAVGVLAIGSDVTEQVHAKKKIEETEGRFRLLADASPILIWMLKGDGSYDYVNQTTLDFLGVTQDEIAAVGWAPFQHPDDVEPTTQALTKAIQNQQRYEMEHRMRHQNGEYRWVLSQANPAFDAKGDVFAYVGSSIDIHDAKIDRQTLAESEARFRSLSDDSPVFVFLIDVDPLAPVSYWNKTWLTYTGQTYEEALGRAWNGILHEDDIPVVMEHYAPAFEKREPYLIPAVRVRRNDGEYRWHAFKGTPRTLANGDFNGYVGMGFDIHEQRLAQQQLETALEQARLSKEAAEMGTFDMDLETGYMHWDDRCRILFGISHHKPVSFDLDFIKRLHPDDQDRVVAVVNQSFDKSLSNGDYDVEYRTIGAEDGVLRWVRAKGKVYFNLQEKPVRFIGSVLDITAQKTAIQKIEQTVDERTRELAQANESLQVINKELQRSNQNLEEFAHAASHDLKEPVRKIHFFTNQLKDQLSTHLKEEEIRSFSRIENATQRMGNLIDDLLLYSHVSHRPHEKEAIDLNEKVQRVLEDLELDIKEKGAVINISKLPVVQGYRRQLQQLFQNLISNALKYSKADEPPQIYISAEKAQEANRIYNVISVQDNGIGFEQQYADKIFQMFTRLHGKGEYSGTGVGLSIVKKVVENHNGSIRVKSKHGAGSTFEIYLPV